MNCLVVFLRNQCTGKTRDCSVGQCVTYSAHWFHTNERLLLALNTIKLCKLGRAGWQMRIHTIWQIICNKFRVKPYNVNMTNFCLGCRVSKSGHMSIISFYNCCLSVRCTIHSVIKWSSPSTLLPGQVASGSTCIFCGVLVSVAVNIVLFL